jgi:hypothetical protein
VHVAPWGTTNAAGEVRLTALPAGGYLLLLIHATEGLMSDVRVAVGEDEDVELELILDGRAAIDLRLVDGELPMPGLACSLINASGQRIKGPVKTDQDGRLLLARLTPASYLLDVSGEGVWPTRTTQTAEVDPVPRALQVRRVGDLTLRVLNQEGLAGADVAVDLVDAATSESVAAWIEQGRVAGEAPLVTDEHGEVHVHAIPHGLYVWTIAGSQGTLLVAPADHVELSVAVE